MPLTLLTAREKLSKIIELGINSADPRSIDRINEAQRRLHSQGIYLGTLQSYAVKVDSVTNTFQKPTQLETIARVSRFSGTEFSSTETVRFLSKGPDVFVSDPTTMLPIAYVSGNANTFKLLDRTLDIKVVEVVGKAVLNEATANTSELLIEDLDALKLMLLALYREENNQLEQAKIFNDQAIKYLRDKTDNLVNVAQKLQHQSTVETSPYGTLGYVRSRLIREMPDLSRINDSELTTLINSAQESSVAHFNFLARQDPDASSKLEFREVFLDSAPLALPSFEVNRLLVLSSQTKKIEEAQNLKKNAFELIERDFNEQIISRRKNTYNGELLSSPVGSLAHTSARLALDNPDLLQKPIQHIRRAVAQAEELLVNSGRWNGTIELLEAQILGGEGEYPLPEYVDAVLLANIADSPVSIYDRDYDFHENGPGWNRPGRGPESTLAIDRGTTSVAQTLNNPNSTIILTTNPNAPSQPLFPFPLISPLNSVLNNGYNNSVFKTLANQSLNIPLGFGIPNFAGSFKLTGPATLEIDPRGNLTGKIISEIVSGVNGSVVSISWPNVAGFKDYRIVAKNVTATPPTTFYNQVSAANSLSLSGLTIGNKYSLEIFGNYVDSKIPSVVLFSATWTQSFGSPEIVSNYHLGISASTSRNKRMKVYLRSVQNGDIVRFIYKKKPKIYINPREPMLLEHFSAIREVTLGVLTGDQEQLAKRMVFAQELLNQQLKEKRGGRIVRPAVQLDAWAIGAIDTRQ